MDTEGREILLEMTRRQFFGRTAKGIGVAALASLLGCLAHLGLVVLLGMDARAAAPITIGLVALIRVGSVRCGLKTRPARGFDGSSRFIQPLFQQRVLGARQQPLAHLGKP